jgi:hypothetical protein
MEDHSFQRRSIGCGKKDGQDGNSAKIMEEDQMPKLRFHFGGKEKEEKGDRHLFDCEDHRPKQRAQPYLK